MYDWVLKYGDNQQYEMRSGYKYPTREIAEKKGEEFILAANSKRIFGVEHYPNPKIEVVEV